MGYLLVPWIHHLIRPGEVDPELEPPHFPVCGFWHLGMNNSGSCRHPLNIPGIHRPGISHTIFVLNTSLEHVGDCFYAPVRMGCLLYTSPSPRDRQKSR